MMEGCFRGLLLLSWLVGTVSGACPNDWHTYQNNCYFVTDSSATSKETWHRAEDYCMRNGAHLASVHSDAERDFIIGKAQDNGYTGALWIGYTNVQNRDSEFAWTDASSTSYKDWGPGQPSTGGLEMCAYTVLGHDNQVLAEWDRHTGHNAIKDLIDKPGDADGVDTFNFGQVIDYEHDECEKKCEAQAGCMAYSYFPSWYHNSNFFQRCLGRSDKTTTFEPDPDVLSGIRIVVPPGYWYNTNCGFRMGFVCKKSTTSTSPLTTPAPTETPGYCPDGFFAVGNKCFMVKQETSSTGKSWEDALNYCRSLTGNQPDLASIQNHKENSALTAQLQENSFGYWIGHHRGTEAAEWVWTDNGRVSYTNWHPGSPESNKGNCAEFWNNKYPGTWNDHHCTDKRGYICQTYKDGTQNNPPQTTPNNCPSNYKPYWYGCYRYQATKMAYLEADDACHADGGHLVSIYNEAENAAIDYYASHEDPLDIFMWTGMYKDEKDNQFKWCDGWTVFYTNWASGEPTRSDGGVAMAVGTGKWYDFQMSDKFTSMCKKTEQTPFTTPTPRPGVCPSDDWVEYGGHCYYFADTPSDGGEDNPLQSWDGAQGRCEALAGKTHRGHLVTIHNEAENKFIHTEMSSRLAANPNIWMAWIGLSKQTGSGFEWVDGSPFQYNSWVPGEPGNQNDQCVQMHIQMWQGLWADDVCSAEKYYICKAEKAAMTEAPSMPPSSGGKCPGDEWETVGDQCFSFYTDMSLRHHNSTAMCNDMGAHLPSIHNDAENWRLREAFRDGVVPWGWIGLYRRPGDDLNTWYWADGTAVDYTNWEQGEPNDSNGREHCVEMDSSNGQWNDVECDIDRIFACKTTKDVGSSGGMSGGAVFGVIVGVLVGILLIATLAGLGLRYMRDNNMLPTVITGNNNVQGPATMDNPNYDASRNMEFAPSPVDTPDYDNIPAQRGGSVNNGVMFLG